MEFVENAKGKAVYVSLARVDDGGPGGVASSRIAIIDRSDPADTARSSAKSSPADARHRASGRIPKARGLYVAHEQDELPDTPNAGQTVCSAFDVSDPFKPELIAQIPLGELKLPSGGLRNKKSINLVYVRPGVRSQAG